MALWDQVTTALALRPKLVEKPRYTVEARTIDSFVDSPDLETQLLRVQGIYPRPWRAASLTEALGVPAVLGAASLIADTVGSLPMRALRNQIELPPDDRPRVIVRPDPFHIPFYFYRGTAWNMATRGEAWWWVAKRDADGNALSILNVNPAEVTVTENPRNLLRPTIRWRNTIMRNEDMKHIPYVLEPGSLRGMGPLQMCQAAISVLVESTDWAANFFADGSHAPLIIKSAVELNDDIDAEENEADRLAAEWAAKGNNRPRVIDPRIESIEQLDEPQQGAQMLDSRTYNNGEVARMFRIPGALLEYAVSGSSLTYQNLSTIFDDFLRRCLRPSYLRPIEQTMSDLLPRSTVAQFDIDSIVLADIKTRYDTYGVGIDKGIISAEEARSFEGLAPGNTDNASVPFSPPAAVPTRLPIEEGRSVVPMKTQEVRCDGKRMLRGLIKPCNAKLADAPPFTGRCWRCGKEHTAAA